MVHDAVFFSEDNTLRSVCEYIYESYGVLSFDISVFLMHLII